MKTITLITITLFLCGSILSVAKAAPPSDVPTAVVKFGDLDTTKAAGQQELYRRLSRAVQSVCRPMGHAPGSIAVGLSRYTACVDKALSSAVAQINRAEFTDYVASRAQKPEHVGIQLASR